MNFMTKRYEIHCVMHMRMCLISATIEYTRLRRSPDCFYVGRIIMLRGKPREDRSEQAKMPEIRHTLIKRV